MLLDLFGTRVLDRSHWLLGLDDAITQPGAIERVRALPGARLRVARLSSKGCRFHPKVIRISASNDPANSLLMVGSANLTSHGFAKNGEAVSFASSGSAAEAADMAAIWKAVWAAGHVPTAAELAAYKTRYDEARKFYRGLARLGAQPPLEQKAAPWQDVFATDAPELSPAQALTLWMDIGSSMGREVEIKRSLMPYFRIENSTPSPQDRGFRTKDGEAVTLNMAFQTNDMWRVNFTVDVPGTDALRVKVGSKLKRSTKAFVFTRPKVGAKPVISFVEIGSVKYRELQRKAAKAGTAGRTRAGPTGRNYGWF